jgi:hypothetical protein
MKDASTTTKRIFRMDRRQISFAKFILEAYDNMAVLTTLDAAKGLVRITNAPGCDNVVDRIVDSLSTEIEIVQVNEETG